MIEVPDFEALYRQRPDPWEVASSPYERRKLEIVLAGLSRPRYRRAWDPAAGTGHLAARLAQRCDEVLASDLVPAAVELATATCAGLANVQLRRHGFPADGTPEPGAEFDLVVLSEFLYYLPSAERAQIGGLLDEVTSPDAEIVAVHWSPEPHDAWLSGAAVQRELARTLLRQDWRLRYRFEDPEFEITGFRRGTAKT